MDSALQQEMTDSITGFGFEWPCIALPLFALWVFGVWFNNSLKNSDIYGPRKRKRPDVAKSTPEDGPNKILPDPPPPERMMVTCPGCDGVVSVTPTGTEAEVRCLKCDEMVYTRSAEGGEWWANVPVADPTAEEPVAVPIAAEEVEVPVTDPIVPKTFEVPEVVAAVSETTLPDKEDGPPVSSEANKAGNSFFPKTKDGQNMAVLFVLLILVLFAVIAEVLFYR
jgi:hypothetical protein